MFSTVRFLWRCRQLRRAASLSPARLADLQTRRLRQLVRHAAEHAPFFRDRYRGLDLDRVELADLPTTSKPELMEHFDRTVTDPAVRRDDIEKFIDHPENHTRLFRGRCVVSHTSGSQGQPMLLVQEQDAIELLFALQFARGNSFSDISLTEGVRRLLEPARLAVVGMKPGFYPSSTAYEHFPDAARAFARLEFFQATDARVVERLSDCRPHVIIAYASILDKLALRAREFPFAPTLRQVVNCSETLTTAARQRIQRAFHVPVLDSYATGECLFLSQGCAAGRGAHINADWVILEVVDEDNLPVPPGQRGKKVLLTNLFNRVQPIIRYEIGDMLALGDDRCPCGSSLPRVAHIEGRTAERLWVGRPGDYHEVTAMIFKNAADYVRNVRDWQAIQEERNHLQVRLVPLPGADVDLARAERSFTSTLRYHGLPSYVRVDYQLVPELQPDPRTHKLRHLVTRFDQPAEVEMAGPHRRTVEALATT
ncbi:MAG: phenylacetate--CoA ligase family protein [Planctomycetia bacterium]|nr:phenylacetate--CoA ligase family protein [Planctomycetia bacterium]